MIHRTKWENLCQNQGKQFFKNITKNCYLWVRKHWEYWYSSGLCFPSVIQLWYSNNEMMSFCLCLVVFRWPSVLTKTFLYTSSICFLNQLVFQWRLNYMTNKLVCRFAYDTLWFLPQYFLKSVIENTCPATLNLFLLEYLFAEMRKKSLVKQNV